VLNLSKLSGDRTSFMLLVPSTEESQASDRSRLVLETTPNGSYVSAMHLPEFGMTLEFAVPPPAPERQIAKAATTTAALGQ
jgi:hypothetical protein